MVRRARKKNTGESGGFSTTDKRKGAAEMRAFEQEVDK